MRYLVIGAAGHAQEVAWSLREQVAGRGEPCEFSFFDDALFARGPLAVGLGSRRRYDRRGRRDTRGATGVELVLGVGLPRTKVILVERLEPLTLPWTTVVHPRATLGPNVRLGEGTYVAAGAIVTLNVHIGRFVTINMHCQVAHDGTVSATSVTLHPDVHLAGNVHVGVAVELGTGSIAIPGICVGDGAVLGAGSVAIRSLQGDRRYVGIPARHLAPVGTQGPQLFGNRSEG